MSRSEQVQQTSRWDKVVGVAFIVLIVGGLLGRVAYIQYEEYRINPMQLDFNYDLR